MSTKKEVATTQENLPFAAERPDYLGTQERGQENVGMNDMTIPRLDILQDLSPQAKKRDPAYIEGAEAGLLFNTVSLMLYGSKVFFVPVYFKVEWLIWKLQSAGGGFSGAFASELEAKAEYDAQGYGNETHKPSGAKDPILSYEIVDTAQHFGLIIKEDGSTEQIVCSMSKSKMKVSRQLNTLCKMAGGDRFSRVYEVSALADTNAQNQEYWNMKVRALGYVPENIYKEAEKMYESVSSGEKSADRGEAVSATETAKDDGKSEY